jgi:prophage antirepressor-like protein
MKLIECKNTEWKVRSLLIEGEPWFVASDLARELGLQNIRQVVSRLDDDERGVCSAYTPGGEQQVSVVSESGLYALIFQSRKPEARAFRKWVTSDLLPQLRNTGEYRLIEVDRERVCELDAGIEGTKKKLARQMAQKWKVEEVEGNVSLKAYLWAAGVTLPAKECMQLGARTNYRTRVFGLAVGKIRQRRNRTAKLSEGHCRYGWHRVATFPPQCIAVELEAMGYPHKLPQADRFEEAAKLLLPEGHRLNPAAPTVSLYLHAR